MPSQTSCVRLSRSAIREATARCGGSGGRSAPAGRVERVLARVAEGRVAHVVPSPIASMRSSFSRSARATTPGDPGRLERVRHARAVVVAGRVDEDLRLALQAPERLRVDDPVAVALERRADGSIRVPAQRVRGSRTSERRAARAAPPARGCARRRHRQLSRRARASPPAYVRSGQRPPGAAGTVTRHSGHTRHRCRMFGEGGGPPPWVGAVLRTSGAASDAAGSDDDRDGAAVGAPGGAGHVARPVRSRGRRSRRRSPPAPPAAERPARADLRQHLVAVAALLVGEAALPEPGVGRGRAGRDRVAADRRPSRTGRRRAARARAPPPSSPSSAASRWTGACRPSTTRSRSTPPPASRRCGSAARIART